MKKKKQQKTKRAPNNIIDVWEQAVGILGTYCNSDWVEIGLFITRA